MIKMHNIADVITWPLRVSLCDILLPVSFLIRLGELIVGILSISSKDQESSTFYCVPMYSTMLNCVESCPRYKRDGNFMCAIHKVVIKNNIFCSKAKE